MAQANLEQIGHMIIIQRVVKDLTVTSVFDQVQILEVSELVRHSRLACSQERRQVTDTHIPALKSQGDFKPRRVAQDLEGLGQPVDLSFRDGLIPGLHNPVQVNHADLVAVCFDEGGFFSSQFFSPLLNI